MTSNHYDPEKLRQCRREKSAQVGRDLSQEDLAKTLDVHRQTIYRAEKGEDVRYELLCDLAEYYDVPVTSWLYPRPKKMALEVAA